MNTSSWSGPSIRGAYRDFVDLPTRWADNDAFGHVNNAAYYGFFDTAVTGWLIRRGLLGLADGPMWVVAETGCRFWTEVAFPQTLAIGLRIARLGRTAVRWELALFREAAEHASAECRFVHVHVDRAGRRPAPIPDGPRAALAALVV